MGIATVFSVCPFCNTQFGHHPHLVPSIRLGANGREDPAASRQAVCLSCIEGANPKREQNGLPPIEILDGAYEGCPEEEL